MFEKYDAYKDSGVEWIGDIPIHWDVKNLRYAFDFLNHRRIPLSALERGNKQGRYPYYGASGIIDYVDAYLFDEKLLLIAEDGANLLSKSTPLAFLAEGKYWVNNHAHILKPKTEAYGFWEKLLCSVDYTVFITGAAQPKLSRENLGGIRLPIPPINEQLKIAKFLEQKTSEIDQAIAIKEQQISLLNERKQIVIQKAVIQGLDPNVPMKDSDIDGIGKIPKHWETFFNRRLFRENSRPVKGDELPLSLSQKDGVIPSFEMKEKSLSPAHRNNFKLCFPNDLVVNRFKGHLGVFFQSNYIGIVTFHYGVFEPAKNVYTKYFELLYHTEQYKTLYAGASNGMSIGLQNLSNLNFYRIKSIVPPLEEQKMICDYADKVEKEHSNLIQKLEIQIEKLKEYKTTLINDAVTGKIKVA